MTLQLFPADDIGLFLNQLQTGHGFAMYRASPLQSGDGLTNWFPFLSRLGPTLASAARSVMPIVKEVAGDALKGAAVAAVNTSTDIAREAVNTSPTLRYPWSDSGSAERY